MSTLYENIRFYCEQAGISGAKLCADVGVSKSTLTSLKNGRTKKIGTDNLAKMAKRLNVSVDQLLGNEPKEGQKEKPDLSKEIGPNMKKVLDASEDLSDAESALVLEYIQKLKQLRI